MKIIDKVVLITGANRGIGQVLCMKRPALTLVVLCLAVALVSWVPTTTASTNVDFDARQNASLWARGTVAASVMTSPIK